MSLNLLVCRNKQFLLSFYLPVLKRGEEVEIKQFNMH